MSCGCVCSLCLREKGTHQVCLYRCTLKNRETLPHSPAPPATEDVVTRTINECRDAMNEALVKLANSKTTPERLARLINASPPVDLSGPNPFEDPRPEPTEINLGDGDWIRVEANDEFVSMRFLYTPQRRKGERVVDPEAGLSFGNEHLNEVIDALEALSPRQRDRRVRLAQVQKDLEEAEKNYDLALKYGTVTEHTLALAHALGLREGKHTADSITKYARDEILKKNEELNKLRGLLAQVSGSLPTTLREVVSEALAAPKGEK